LIIDSDRNIIVRHAFLSNICSIDILNKNISALVIDITTLVQQPGYISYQTSLPKNVRELLGVYEGDIFTLSLDESDNIVINQKIVKNLVQDAKLISTGRFSISEESRNIFNIIPGDKILWIIDEDGNIIMRNVILSDNCI
jgi:bifunctional DNA-binding transcriptional regulator/antitoxin component of YhaV-PrlF toxin-antitoxin module